MSSLNREVSWGVLRTFMGQILPPPLPKMNCTERMVTLMEDVGRGDSGLLNTLGERVGLRGVP